MIVPGNPQLLSGEAQAGPHQARFSTAGSPLQGRIALAPAVSPQKTCKLGRQGGIFFNRKQRAEGLAWICHILDHGPDQPAAGFGSELAVGERKPIQRTGIMHNSLDELRERSPSRAVCVGDARAHSGHRPPIPQLAWNA